MGSIYFWISRQNSFDELGYIIKNLFKIKRIITIFASLSLASQSPVPYQSRPLHSLPTKCPPIVHVYLTHQTSSPSLPPLQICYNFSDLSQLRNDPTPPCSFITKCPCIVHIYLNRPISSHCLIVKCRTFQTVDPEKLTSKF